MNNKVYITGDKHGDFLYLFKFCERFNTTKDDTLIILGDAGINIYLDGRDEKTKKELADLPITLFCIKGNHELHPDEMPEYEITEYFGAPAYGEPEYPNLIFAKDGEIYDIYGQKCIVIGGAYSVDKPSRLAFGGPWFETEQPSEEIKKYIESQLDKVNGKVDYVLSHTCPKTYMPTWLFISGLDQSRVDNSTEQGLDYIDDKLECKRWYFGHFHGEREYNKFKMMYDDIAEFGVFKLEGDEPFKLAD